MVPISVTGRKSNPAHIGTPFARVLLEAERERCFRARRYEPRAGGLGIVPSGA